MPRKLVSKPSVNGTHKAEYFRSSGRKRTSDALPEAAAAGRVRCSGWLNQDGLEVRLCGLQSILVRPLNHRDCLVCFKK